MKRFAGLAVLAVLAGWMVGSSARAGDGTVLTVDESMSSVEVEVCLAIGCDSDTSGVAGFMTVVFDPADENQMFLSDFEFAFTDPIDLNISTFGGAIDIDAPALSLMYGAPGSEFGPSDISDGAFEYVGVPVIGGGLLSYNATGTVCAILTGAGIPCTSAIDLSALGILTADAISGTISFDGADITIVSMPSIDTPIDPSQPDLGTLTATGDVVANGTLMVIGDGDGDGDVDLFDFEMFVNCVGVEPVCAVFDFDEDADVDFEDFRVFQLLFTGP